MNDRYEGLTILEVLLVLVIGAAILLFGMRQYLSYRQDADVFQVQANVDTIFEAMDQYYRANCYGSTEIDVMNHTIFKPGSLYPTNVATAPVPVPLSALIHSGYFEASTIPMNPLVDNSSGNGYIMQFNEYSNPKYENGKQVGQIVVWKPQVAVLLQNASTAPQYRRVLTADCLSTLSGGVVTSCATSGNTGNYAVWERLPSLPNSKINSNFWTTMPVVKEFTQMYNIDNEQLNDAAPGNHYYTCTN